MLFQCASSKSEDLYGLINILKNLFPHLFYGYTEYKETGTERESREQNKTSSSNYSFPLKRIPREQGKPRPKRGWESSTAAARPSLLRRALGCTVQRAPKRKSREAPGAGDTHRLRANCIALGYVGCQQHYERETGLPFFFFSILNDTRQWISNSTKGAFLTPATTWFKCNVWPAIPGLSLATNEIKKTAEKMVPVSSRPRNSCCWLFFYDGHFQNFVLLVHTAYFKFCVMEIHYFSLARLQIRSACTTRACTDLWTSALLLAASGGPRWSDCCHEVLCIFLKAQILIHHCRASSKIWKTIRNTTKANSSIKGFEF